MHATRGGETGEGTGEQTERTGGNNNKENNGAKQNDKTHREGERSEENAQGKGGGGGRRNFSHESMFSVPNFQKKNDPSNIRVRNVCCFFLRVGPVYPPMMFQRRFWNWGMQKTNDFNETIFHEKTKCARSSRFGLGFRGKHFLVRARIILNMVDKKCELCSWNYFCLLGERGKGNYSTACGVPTQTRCLVWARCWFDAGIRGAKQLFEQSARSTCRPPLARKMASNLKDSPRDDPDSNGNQTALIQTKDKTSDA